MNANIAVTRKTVTISYFHKKCRQLLGQGSEITTKGFEPGRQTFLRAY